MSIKDALESLYIDKCDVYERKDYIRDNKSTSKRDKLVISDLPCRISYSNSPANTETDKAAYKSQSVKLFFSSDVKIKPGSKISVTRCGVTTFYRASGEPAIYPSHKEIELELLDVKA